MCVARNIRGNRIPQISQQHIAAPWRSLVVVSVCSAGTYSPAAVVPIQTMPARGLPAGRRRSCPCPGSSIAVSSRVRLSCARLANTPPPPNGAVKKLVVVDPTSVTPSTAVPPLPFFGLAFTAAALETALLSSWVCPISPTPEGDTVFSSWVCPISPTPAGDTASFRVPSVRSQPATLLPKVRAIPRDSAALTFVGTSTRR